MIGVPDRRPIHQYNGCITTSKSLMYRDVLAPIHHDTMPTVVVLADVAIHQDWLVQQMYSYIKYITTSATARALGRSAGTPQRTRSDRWRTPATIFTPQRSSAARRSRRALGRTACAHRAAFRAFGRQTGTNIFSRGAVCFRRAGPKSKNACKGSHPTDQTG
jgi:hypothetical protein